MNDRIGEIKALLRQRDYLTVVHKDNDGCIVTYPHPKLIYRDMELPRLVECFTIQRGKDPGFWVNTTFDSDSKERFISIPEYAMRLYIVCEVAACNTQIPIDAELMTFVDEDEKEHENIEDIIPEPSTEEDKKREGFLYGLVVEARDDGFPPEFDKVAETHGVAEGYRLIRKFHEE